MLTVPFLTKLDPRGAVKGSRDPLGVQPIWTRIGRKAVGNLTTVSTSVRDFTVLLLGYHFAEQLAHDRADSSELSTFLKWEQLASYARAHVNKDTRFRGTERVRAALNSGGKVTISDETAHQILGNQKIYGLWGLYTVPARSSGLLEGDPTRLTPAGRDLVEGLYVPLLEKHGGPRMANRIKEILASSKTRIDPDGSDRPLLEAIGRVLVLKLLAREREVYRHHLVNGGDDDSTGGRQEQLATLLYRTTTDPSFVWSPAALVALETGARRIEGGDALATNLERIRACESLLAPCVALFIHLLGMDGKPLGEAAKRVRTQWGAHVTTVKTADIRRIEAELGGMDADAGKRWVDIATTASTGAYDDLIKLLLVQNREVMGERGSTSWLDLRDDHFHVRFHEERGELPKKAELPTLWRHSYFIDALRLVAGQIGPQS